MSVRKSEQNTGETFFMFQFLVEISLKSSLLIFHVDRFTFF